jgi:hypothetical protein
MRMYRELCNEPIAQENGPWKHVVPATISERLYDPLTGKPAGLQRVH